MNLPEQAFSILEAIRQYIPNARELPEVHKRKSKNFVRFAKRLLRMKSSHLRNTLDLFEKDFAKENIIGSREWLLEKVKELKYSKRGYAAVNYSVP